VVESQEENYDEALHRLRVAAELIASEQNEDRKMGCLVIPKYVSEIGQL